MAAGRGSAGAQGKVFLALGLAFGLLFVVLVPPFQAPDEWNHFFRAYQVSKGRVVSGKDPSGIAGERVPVSVHLTAMSLFYNVPHTPKNMGRLGALLERDVLDNEHLNPFTKEKKKGRLEVQLSLLDVPLKPGQSFFPTFPGTAAYPPVPYLPQAGGIALGRAVGLSPIVLIYMGRAANLLVWLALVYAALRLTPFYGALFALLALTPTSLLQAASLSADGMANALALLLVALVFRRAFGGDEGGFGGLAAIFLVSALLALSKFYVFLPLLYLLVPANREGTARRYAVALVLFAACAALVWYWYGLVKDLMVRLRPGVHPSGQLERIAADPLGYALVVFETFKAHGVEYMRQFVGRLGHYGPDLPWQAAAVHGGVLLLAALFGGSPAKVGVREKSVALMVASLSALAVVTMLYLTWTPLGGAAIEGIQGRYFFPLAPLVLMAFYVRRRGVRKGGQLPLALYLLALLGYTAYVLVRAYYA